MLRCLLFFLLVLFSSFSFKDKATQAQVGQFIVTEESKNYSILFVRSLNTHLLQLEEITTTTSQVKSIKNQWQAWIQKGAPGHTAWVVYTIDLEKNTMKECYSFNRKGWMPIDDKDSFLTRLLSLPLIKADPTQRKRIGPPPATGETDRRGFWNPPLVVEGKKQDKPSVTVFTTKWPEDETPLSLCDIELYFDSTRPDFLFPCWIEVKSPHYSHHLRVVDSGSNLQSFHKFLPTQTEQVRKL
jgi:hypothetical protein